MKIYYRLHFIHSLISLDHVGNEIHNLQRVFRPRGSVPYIGYIGMCSAKRVWFFSRFGLK